MNSQSLIDELRQTARAGAVAINTAASQLVAETFPRVVQQMREEAVKGLFVTRMRLWPSQSSDLGAVEQLAQQMLVDRLRREGVSAEAQIHEAYVSLLLGWK